MVALVKKNMKKSNSKNIIFSKLKTNRLVGMPAETATAICAMVMGGVLHDFPALKVCFAHGGGSYPFTIGRIEHGYRGNDDLCSDL